MIFYHIHFGLSRTFLKTFLSCLCCQFSVFFSNSDIISYHFRSVNTFFNFFLSFSNCFSKKNREKNPPHSEADFSISFSQPYVKPFFLISVKNTHENLHKDILLIKEIQKMVLFYKLQSCPANFGIAQHCQYEETDPNKNHTFHNAHQCARSLIEMCIRGSLRTVIVTAAVYWGLNSKLRLR